MPKDRLFELILFDLEGTLVDFQWQLNDAVKQIICTLANAGIDTSRLGATPGYADLYNKSRDITKGWDPQKTENLFDQLAIIYDKYDQDALTRWAPYPDTLPLLEMLKKNDYRMGIVSNCGSKAVTAVLKRFSFMGYFEIVLSRNDTYYLKPFPDGLNQAIHNLKIPAQKTLFVGDSYNDILAANKVPMSSCFLSGGESIVTGENSHTATFQISSLSELFNILK